MRRPDGGAVISLFMVDAQRLSVHIDDPYTGGSERDEMLGRRPSVEGSIAVVARCQGYPISRGRGGHAGRTFLVGYRSQWGVDHVKVDCIYMNRSPILQPCCERRP